MKAAEDSLSQNIKLRQIVRSLRADLTTPVAAYMRIRDRYPNSLLLESSDYQSRENNMSYVCCKRLASLTTRGLIGMSTGCEVPGADGDQASSCRTVFSSPSAVATALHSFTNQFRPTLDSMSLPRGAVNGLFCYFSYDSVGYFEDIPLPSYDEEKQPITVDLALYGHILAFDHFRSQLSLLSTAIDDGSDASQQERLLEEEADAVLHLLLSGPLHESSFELLPSSDANASTTSDEGFLRLIESAKRHIQRGDVFQLVLSRRFITRYAGDDFSLYRALRSVNPSPYLFYFDLGEERVFGASPEAQLIIRPGRTPTECSQAMVNPIAGTKPSSGDHEADARIRDELLADRKEAAEHAMLVDLARNDLSKHCHNVSILALRELQTYSHVIHLVSKVRGDVPPNTRTLSLLADTFPAGTLTGAPKYRALELIAEHEPHPRGFYGGAVGVIGFDGSATFAIIIRAFHAQRNILQYQAGAGIVHASKPENELAEISAKVAALRQAISLANEVPL